MINTRHFISLLILFMALISCQSEKTPDQVSEHFWLGIKTNNSALVRKYSLDNSVDESEDLAQFEKITNVTFDKIMIDGTDAEVETCVTTTFNKEKVDIDLKTYLENHNGVWKVNYQKTVLPLTINQNMANVLGDIEAITEEITEQLEESVGEIKDQVVPEIKSEIKRAEEEMMLKIPELKNIFNEFLRELEKSLEELIPAEQQKEPETHET